MFGYRVPAPDQAMLISGGRRGQGGAPFRVVTGHGKFVLPVFRKIRFLTLAMCESEVAETCVTRQGIALTVRAVIAFKVGNDTESIVNAGQRFLSDQDQMSVLTGRIFAGHLRSIIGSMTVEEIVTERQKLATEVLETSKTEMAKIGLIVDSLQIQSIDDGDTGYIDAMSAPHKAAIQRQAQIAQAQATQAVGRGAAGGRAQPGRVRPADRRGPGASTRPRWTARRPRPPRPDRWPRRTPSRRCSPPRPNWPSARPSCASSSWWPRSSSPPRRRPSGSGCWRMAEAERMKIQAEAAASHDRVALDRMLIDQLPQIVKEAAGGPRRRQRQRPQRRRRPRRDRRRPGRPGPDDPGLGPPQPRHPRRPGRQGRQERRHRDEPGPQRPRRDRVAPTGRRGR